MVKHKNAITAAEEQEIGTRNEQQKKMWFDSECTELTKERNRARLEELKNSTGLQLAIRAVKVCR